MSSNTQRRGLPRGTAVEVRTFNGKITVSKEAIVVKKVGDYGYSVIGDDGRRFLVDAVNVRAKTASLH